MANNNHTTEDEAIEEIEEQIPVERRIINEAFDWIEIFVFSATFVIILFSFFLRLTIVHGSSMEDTLIEGEFVAVSDIYFSPKRGDIIVIHDKSNKKHSEPLVKRVIATEGQVVDIDFDSWVVTVDGVVIDEPYIKLVDNYKLTSNWQYPYVVPENHVFVMGDNRNKSADSRSSEVGPVDVRCIVGKAILRVFPISKFSYLGGSGS